jgi:hypothetical protein
MASSDKVKKVSENAGSILGGAPSTKPRGVAKRSSKEAAGERPANGVDFGTKHPVGRRPKGDTRPRATDAYAYTSLALDMDAYEKIRQIAIRNGFAIREIVNSALRLYIGAYEAKHGEIISPRESRISADSLI